MSAVDQSSNLAPGPGWGPATTLALVAAALLGACSEKGAKPVAPAPPTPTARSQTKALDARTARDILRVVRRLKTMKPESLTPAERATRKDAAKLVGRWRVLHTIYGTNGKKSPPRPPLAPTEWKLTKDGRIDIKGGMRIRARYLYTGDKLFISGFGPKQVYSIVTQTPRRLVLVSRIAAGNVRIENTTVLARVR